MNIRKPTDYSILFSELDRLMAEQLSQMNLYCEIGRLVSSKAEKGAAVVASEHLRAAYPAADGFSSRNLRRMRTFYAAYEESPEIMRLAMNLGWTRNVAILEGCGNSEERAWYVRAALRFGWKKAKLLEAIESQAWLHSSLDEPMVSCYTEEKEVTQESECDEEDTFCVPWKYLSQSDGRVRDEGLGQEGWAGVAIPYRVGSNQPRGEWQSGLSSGAAQAGRTWDILRRPRSAAAHQSGLRQVRPADWHGQRKPAEYAPHLRWRPGWQAPPLDGLHRPPRRCCRPLVHGRFRGNVAGCAVGVSGLAGFNCKK